MFVQLERGSAKFLAQYQASTGRVLPFFHLKRYYTDPLITGYEAKRRTAVVHGASTFPQSEEASFIGSPQVVEYLDSLDRALITFTPVAEKSS